jgi:ubiquinone/menaquinone biosynthesis C-methylase UbiE
MVDPRTDRDRLVGHAYKTSAPFLARTGLYRYQRDPIDIRRWVLDRARRAPGARMLDVGCGPGRYLATVREAEPSSDALGMDLSAGMAAEASAFAPTVVGDAQAIPFPMDAFDVVLAAHMLYHVPDIDAALREIARVLRPDGTLLVVLNGRAHLPVMRTLVRQVLRDVVRESAARSLPQRSSERLSIETAEPVLTKCFSVLAFEHLQRVLDVPDAEPVVAYVDSMRSFYEPYLPADFAWPALLDRVRARVDATIGAEGVWTDTSDAGCFVCRPQ